MGDPSPLERLTKEALVGLKLFPSESPVVASECYVVKHAREDSILATDNNKAAKVWFKSPPLDARTIRRIKGVRLFAESHDQGWVDNLKDGNWTWLEVAVLENESATEPKEDAQGQVTAYSHSNTANKIESTWHEGKIFEKDSRLLSSLEMGNVLAVRLCAQYVNWENTAEVAYLALHIVEDNEPVPIKPIDILKHQDHPPYRRNVNNWYNEAEEALKLLTSPKALDTLEADMASALMERSLFIEAMIKFQSLSPEDQLSYFRIAGIHGFPANVSWNMGFPPVGDAEDVDKAKAEGRWGFYCPHNRLIFPTWHRAYMMLFERTVSDLIKELAKNRGPKWVEAARTWRLPYWDWAQEARLPNIVVNETITVLNTDGTIHEVPNPMYSFRMPKGKAMGDKAYGDYRIDSNEEGPWDLCKGTNRHSISYHDEHREWCEGRSDNEKANKAIGGTFKLPREGEGEKKIFERLTLKDGVFRLLTQKYNDKYKYFASTRYHPKKSEDKEKNETETGTEEDKLPPQGYLSLEALHNSVHDFTGGTDLLNGCGHMSSVPVAAFDPVFWLHHCNIDRLFHFWQLSNLGSWFPLEAETNKKEMMGNKKSDDDREHSDDPLKPFHNSNTEFYSSSDVRYVDRLHYTYDDVKYFRGEHREIVRSRYIAYLNKVYGPGESYYGQNSDGDVDPIINVVYDRYAFAGLSYKIHFFLGKPKRRILYQEQDNLVGTIYTFSAPFGAPTRGSTGCKNCAKQANTGVLSRAQVPLTRKVDISDRRDSEKALAHLQSQLHWVAVLDTGAKIPRTALKDLKMTLLLGTNKLGNINEVPVFEDYDEKEWDWEGAEL